MADEACLADPFEHAPSAEDATAARRVSDLLRGGDVVDDAEFDRLYPPRAQVLSPVHWTPVQVAKRAADFLASSSAARVLDVGSGAGKLCIVGALTTPGTFFGVEERPALAHLAGRVARAVGADRASFLSCPAEAIAWSGFSGFYFYNPFGEQFLPVGKRIDERRRGLRSYGALVRTVIARLHGMPPGTRVATYHGFGGPMPPGFRRVSRERFGSGFLALYVREGPTCMVDDGSAELSP
jgi:hypothetical protein